MGYMVVAQSTEPQSTFLLLARVQYNIRVKFPFWEEEEKKKEYPRNPETSKVHLNSFMNEQGSGT